MATIHSVNMSEVNGVKEEKGSWGLPDESYQEVSETFAHLSSCVGAGSSCAERCLYWAPTAEKDMANSLGTNR